MSLNVTALAGSPRARSFTHRLLDAFLAGLGEGATVDRLEVRRLQISPCRGCFTCWFQTPGRCVQDDDHARVAASLDRADTIILAAPLYFDGFPGPLKTLLDRLVCRIEPFFTADAQGRSVHRSNRVAAGGTPPVAILIATCGFPEPANFTPLEAHFSAVCRNAAWTDGGKLLVPGVGALELAGRRQEVIDLTTRAGEALAAVRHIPDSIQDRLRGPWVEPETARRALNRALEERRRRIQDRPARV